MLIVQLGDNEDRKSSRLLLQMSNFRKDSNYSLYYVSISHLMVTGVIPLIALIILNYLVYKHLVRRRSQVLTLGKI